MNSVMSGMCEETQTLRYCQCGVAVTDMLLGNRDVSFGLAQQDVVFVDVWCERCEIGGTKLPRRQYVGDACWPHLIDSNWNLGESEFSATEPRAH